MLRPGVSKYLPDVISVEDVIIQTENVEPVDLQSMFPNIIACGTAIPPQSTAYLPSLTRQLPSSNRAII